MIPTWAERCEKFSNEIVTNAKIQQMMQEEIDKLREALKLRELTDEEIRKVADEVFKNYKNWHYYQIDFAKAIIKCASGNILSDNEVKD